MQVKYVFPFCHKFTTLIGNIRELFKARLHIHHALKLYYVSQWSTFLLT
jgi:hypothetical protein